ncbi:unnamed protein product [Strongylus vulgaris]|uniref:Glycine-zipper-containing OmpA-like membrane domain-containing protein n=1 Tax=Strongylus vulgaris TaxID=40348 RepID=A0A3P7HZT7_STRVU|nr:unnamed protein product [Strongylus vulgaris]
MTPTAVLLVFLMLISRSLPCYVCPPGTYPYYIYPSNPWYDYGYGMYGMYGMPWGMGGMGMVDPLTGAITGALAGGLMGLLNG